MKNKIQKNSKEQLFKSGEVMSMLEQVNDGIQLVAEQHGEIIKRLDKHDERFDNFEGRFDNLEGKFDNLETKVDHLQDDVTEIKHKLSEKVDREEFEKLEKRMIKLEKLVFAKLA